LVRFLVRKILEKTGRNWTSAALELWCIISGSEVRFMWNITPLWHGEMAHRDTVLVSIDNSQHGMYGMLVALVLLFFSFHDVYLDKDIPCALANWFIPNGDKPDELTGVVETECEGNTHTLEVIHLDTIVRGTHLLPIYGSAFLPEDFHYSVSLGVFKSYFVNHYIDHHAHKFLKLTSKSSVS
jgi:hypothetical protein